MSFRYSISIATVLLACSLTVELMLSAETVTGSESPLLPTMEEAKAKGAQRSSYRISIAKATSTEIPEANLETFRTEIAPVLKRSCMECHGPDKQKAKFRVDTLDPDLLHGEDVSWWLEVMDVLSNDEMPPEDGPELGDEDRSKIIAWLATEIQVASEVRRAEQGFSSFRRMTRYEYNYALQDLLGLELDFAKDLLPDPVSEDGFRNSSEMLRMTSSQYRTYLELNRNALNRATVKGERPEMLFWGVSAKQASADKFAKFEDAKNRPSNRNQRRGRGRGGRGGGRGAHYKNTETGQTVAASWSFRRAVNAWAPTITRPEVPELSEYIAILPPGERLVVELGNRLPDEGTLRVRIRASRVSTDPHSVSSVALEFGWQGHNNSKASFRISHRDLVIDAPNGKPEFYQWDIPLSEIYPRNPVRKTVELGEPKRTNPSEYIRLYNTSLSRSADVQFDYVEVSAPAYEQWPPASHREIFIESENRDDESAYAREIVSGFMARAWRRSVTQSEVDEKMAYFARIRPKCDDFQQAVIEVLATFALGRPMTFADRSAIDRLTSELRMKDDGLATLITLLVTSDLFKSL